jgi:2-alkenal reductase
MWRMIFQRKSARIVAMALLVMTLLAGIGFGGVMWGRSTEVMAVAQTTTQATPITTPVIGHQEALADLYDRVLPSVVNIQVIQKVGTSQMPLPFGFPFETPDIPMRGEGSGFVYDSEGHIVTNNHVVDQADRVIVTFYNGLWAEAEVVATDPQSDLAVLKVTPPQGVELRPLPLAKSGTLRVGHTVVAIGNPFGLEGSMTVGIVSAMGRSFPVGEATGGRYTLPDVIQTDAAINPGNSGGPLLNLAGEVVGVNFAIESPVRASAGVGFAIPVSIVERVVPALIREGRYHYAWLGIAGSSITPELAEALDLPENTLGAYVQEVTPNGPADKAGIKGGTRRVRLDGNEIKAGGDIITAIDGNPVRQFNDLVSYLVTKAAPGQKVKLTVWRNEKELQIEVTLGERPQEEAQQAEQQRGFISARAAIRIARDEVQRRGLLKGNITETVATLDVQDGQHVWVVELSDGRQTARVVVDAESGDVIEARVE